MQLECSDNAIGYAFRMHTQCKWWHIGNATRGALTMELGTNQLCNAFGGAKTPNSGRIYFASGGALTPKRGREYLHLGRLNT